MSPNHESPFQNPPVEAESRPPGLSDAWPELEIKQFTASDGYCFHYRHWKSAAQSPRGYVVALHGIQSHSGWYDFSGNRLSRAGFEVSYLDRRGSGLNEASRGDAPHVDRLVNDVRQFLADVCHRRDQRSPGSPVVLLGVSWGGKLATVITAQSADYVDALALLSPGICARFRPGLFQRVMLSLAVSLSRAKYLTRIPLDDETLFTSDPDWQRFIRDDPIALHQVTISFLKASCELDRLVVAAPRNIFCPVLLMLAEK
ncbi:MAG: alpha/beta fold hydrolase, partial [Planctomycetes bacterium]|nr:alpha/beta fold hydrolase [Planctomycetota bacterium]